LSADPSLSQVACKSDDYVDGVPGTKVDLNADLTASTGGPFDATVRSFRGPADHVRG
jgi:hypothetical protein